MDAAVSQWGLLWKRRCAVLYKLRVTFRYHQRRQRFFDLADKLTKIVGLMLGLSLLGEEVKKQWPLVASGIALLGLAALVFGYGDRKQTHKELAQAASQLCGRIDGTPQAQIDDERICQWEAAYADLNAREPPALKTLVILCEWEECVANGHPDLIPKPPWYKSWPADFIS